jgi:hypothetical protein
MFHCGIKEPGTGCKLIVVRGGGVPDVYSLQP